jgi:hypothetical protein
LIFFSFFLALCNPDRSKFRRSDSGNSFYASVVEFSPVLLSATLPGNAVAHGTKRSDMVYSVLASAHPRTLCRTHFKQSRKEACVLSLVLGFYFLFLFHSSQTKRRAYNGISQRNYILLFLPATLGSLGSYIHSNPWETPNS